jgi:hypothetical protein
VAAGGNGSDDSANSIWCDRLSIGQEDRMAGDVALWLIKLSHLSLTDEKRSRIEYVRGQAYPEPRMALPGNRGCEKEVRQWQEY